VSKRKKKKQMFSIEFNNTVDAIVDKLQNPVDDLPEGFIIEYEVDNLQLLAQVLRRKLPISPPTRHIIGRRRVKIPKGNVVLWHGTSLYRAYSILESGFKSKKRGVFFSSNILESSSYAERRAADGRSEPAIFAAIFDLNTLKYGKEFQIQTHFIFKPRVANRIVKYILTYRGLYSIGKIITEANRYKDDLTDISIMQVSGNTGIAYWLNTFLKLDDSGSISENHSAVGQIKTWVDEQYANDRMIPITDEEMLILAKEYLPEYFQ